MTMGAAFPSKAEILAQLEKQLRTGKVLPQVRFTVAEWKSGRNRVLETLAAQDWSADLLIVRSSAAAEDRAGQSLAGHFQSVPDVALADVAKAIDIVIASFGAVAAAADAVFVQPMLTNVALSGVVFTRDPNTDAPYIVLNYDTHGDTAAVTSGRRANLKTYVCWKASPRHVPEPLDKVVALAAELEERLGNDALDIEFALTAGGELYLFQVRPLAGERCGGLPEPRHDAILKSIAEKIAQANRPHPYLRGRRTLFGVMPDWNPAEIIGIRPRPLALSLYRNLITDSVWAYQRHNYGYRNLRSFPLMRSFHGLPYIDVRVSFNSFIPSDIGDDLADRLVDLYIEDLSSAPTLHDKVEFEIVFSCYAFDIDERLSRLLSRGFSVDDAATLKDSLRRLTNRIVHGETGLWRGDVEKIAYLEQRQDNIANSDMDVLEKVYWLLEDCKRYGTLPFAGLARAGFVAVQMLRSLVAVGVLDRQQYDAFMGTVDSVSGRMARDLKQLPRSEFLARYGHLRPGTYDILSFRYDEAPEVYLGGGDEAVSEAPQAPASFALSLAQMRQISDLLGQHDLNMDVVGLFDFIRAGIEGREQAKFVFTRSLSKVLQLLAELGQRHGLSREDMSFFDAGAIEGLYVASGDIGEVLRNSIAYGRSRYQETLRLNLPPLISSADDVWSFEVPAADPNFVTQRVVEAVVVPHTASPDLLKGAIVVIPSADPGFDWIFSQGVAGFITAYGGINSHMAIRAGELGLPAVIGAGEAMYAAWKAARRLRIDCANRRVDILR